LKLSSKIRIPENDHPYVDSSERFGSQMSTEVKDRCAHLVPRRETAEAISAAIVWSLQKLRFV
jgi:hypothetical protein